MLVVSCFDRTVAGPRVQPLAATDDRTERRRLVDLAGAPAPGGSGVQQQARERRTRRRQAVVLSRVSLRLPVTAVLVALLAACGSDDQEHARRLDAACQDDRSRAYAAAGRTTVGGEVTEAEALASMRTYVAEVRRTPVCFARPLRREVERAAAAVERGELLELEHPKAGG